MTQIAEECKAESAASTRTDLALFLFHCRAELTEAAVTAGLDGVIVDWERRGKAERQAGWDTEINAQGPADLRCVAKLGFPSVLCRVNPQGCFLTEEVEAALGEGATELILPMVERPSEVETFLDIVRGRAPAGILVETCEALEHLPAFSRLPLSRVYVGLNDLAISRGSRSIFAALTDGTVSRVKATLEQPFGVAGATHPGKGSPIPCRLILAELARLGCSFTFLRRSFYRDTPPERFSETVGTIRDAFKALSVREPEEVASDRAELQRRVAELQGGERTGPARA